MSDFLSQFSGEKTDGVKQIAQFRDQPTTEEELFSKTGFADSATDLYLNVKVKGLGGALEESSQNDIDISDVEGRTQGISSVKHQTVVDAAYKRKKALKYTIIGLVVVLVLAGAFGLWFALQQMEMPDLVGQNGVEAQKICTESELEAQFVQVFSLEPDGRVIDQSVAAGTQIMKGAKIELTVSKGPDPDEQLALPDFVTITKTDAASWIEANRANNIRLVEEFSAEVAKGAFIRIEFRSSEINASNYTRREHATVVYSKGIETFEQNIAVPNFYNADRVEAESWAQKNGIALTVEETYSDTVDVGKIISQSVAADAKLAKNDAMSIVVSLGKAIVVPDFSRYSAETAPSASSELSVNVATRYSANVPYGHFISQSVAAGTRLLPGDTMPITVTYSEGLPYLSDLRGSSEGELPALFFNTYTSKGADVTYTVKYVSSAEPKGSVVAMSDYARFVPLKFNVVISISLGDIEPPVAPTTDENDDKGDGDSKK